MLRRLNRVEYQNTVRDLLGIELELKELLPPDAVPTASTSGEAHHVSSFLMEKYLEAADKALDVAIANGPQPPLIKKRYSLKDERSVKVSDRERLPHSRRRRVVMLQLVGVAGGHARPVLSARPRPVSLPHLRLGDSERRQAGHVSASMPARCCMADEEPPRRLLRRPGRQADGRSSSSITGAAEHHSHLPYGLPGARPVNKIGADKYDGPGLAVQWVEVEGPLHDAWPPASHRRIFGDLPQKPAPGLTTTASASRSSRRTPRPTPSGSCATSPAGPFAAP